MFGLIKRIQDKSDSDVDDLTLQLRRELDTLTNMETIADARLNRGVTGRRIVTRILRDRNVTSDSDNEYPQQIQTTLQAAHLSRRYPPRIADDDSDEKEEEDRIVDELPYKPFSSANLPESYKNGLDVDVAVNPRAVHHQHFPVYGKDKNSKGTLFGGSTAQEYHAQSVAIKNKSMTVFRLRSRTDRALYLHFSKMIRKQREKQLKQLRNQLAYEKQQRELIKQQQKQAEAAALDYRYEHGLQSSIPVAPTPSTSPVEFQTSLPQDEELEREINRLKDTEVVTRIALDSLPDYHALCTTTRCLYCIYRPLHLYSLKSSHRSTLLTTGGVDTQTLTSSATNHDDNDGDDDNDHDTSKTHDIISLPMTLTTETGVSHWESLQKPMHRLLAKQGRFIKQIERVIIALKLALPIHQTYNYSSEQDRLFAQTFASGIPIVGDDHSFGNHDIYTLYQQQHPQLLSQGVDIEPAYFKVMLPHLLTRKKHSYSTPLQFDLKYTTTSPVNPSPATEHINPEETDQQQQQQPQSDQQTIRLESIQMPTHQGVVLHVKDSYACDIVTAIATFHGCYSYVYPNYHVPSDDTNALPSGQQQQPQQQQQQSSTPVLSDYRDINGINHSHLFGILPDTIPVHSESIFTQNIPQCLEDGYRYSIAIWFNIGNCQCNNPSAISSIRQMATRQLKQSKPEDLLEVDDGDHPETTINTSNHHHHQSAPENTALHVDSNGILTTTTATTHRGMKIQDINDFYEPVYVGDLRDIQGITVDSFTYGIPHAKCVHDMLDRDADEIEDGTIVTVTRRYA